MQIEVVAPDGEPQKVKGDLLESLMADFMRIQGYHVIEQVRLTGCELDLLCKHDVSSKSIYVECKAHREPLSAAPLRTLLGTIDFHDYSEGWLINTNALNIVTI